MTFDDTWTPRGEIIAPKSYAGKAFSLTRPTQTRFVATNIH